jgi:hypothetical protein
VHLFFGDELGKIERLKWPEKATFHVLRLAFQNPISVLRFRCFHLIHTVPHPSAAKLPVIPRRKTCQLGRPDLSPGGYPPEAERVCGK